MIKRKRTDGAVYQQRKVKKEKLLKMTSELESAVEKQSSVAAEYAAEKIGYEAELTTVSAELAAAKSSLAARDKSIVTTTATGEALEKARSEGKVLKCMIVRC